MSLTITDIKPVVNIPSRPWKETTMPRRVLAIRLQAMGDLVITLPYLQQLKKSLPSDSILDLLTRKEVDGIAKSIELFDHVYSIAGGRNVKKQFWHVGWMMPKLFLNRYDVVIDLQNNIVSQFVRKTLRPKAWSLFDRFSPIAAAESTRLTIEAAGVGKSWPSSCFKLKKDQSMEILRSNGWDGESDLVVLNPAGAFITRNWPIENYVAFARLWLDKFAQTQFLIIGVSNTADKAKYLKQTFGNKLIDLVNKTTPAQAFAIIQATKFVLSEDSGLMHMAWVSGIATVAMFGSTRSDRARPLGRHTLLLHSSDLQCGNCMRETCIYENTHCLTRYSAEFMFEKAQELIVAQPRK